MNDDMRSILEELDMLSAEKDVSNIVESRAQHVISGAINLIQYIQEKYDPDTSLELERRLINSIRGRDAKKFTRAIHRIKESKGK